MRQCFVQLMGLCLVLLVAGSMSTVSAQNQQSPNQSASSGIFVSLRRPAVNPAYVMRVINVAESTYRRNHSRFGSWRELCVSGVLWDVQRAEDEWRKVAFATGPEAIPGYRLNLLVSADGSAYSISLQDTDSNGCGLSLFSDQNGLIYQGAPLDCPKMVDWHQHLR
jgi:hypothetical protein